MNTHDFLIPNGDTDSIMICKSDMTSISEEEQKRLLNELNSFFPTKIKFADDGYYQSVLIIRAKNYVLWDGKKAKTKGSALKASLKEPALKEFINEILMALLLNKQDTLLSIYNKYAIEIMNVKDIFRWCSKKTITETMLASKRSNETKVLDALQGVDFQVGNKYYFFFNEDETLCLRENFKGSYNKSKLLEKLFKTLEIFETVMDVKQFPNYALKKNKKLLEELK